MLKGSLSTPRLAFAAAIAAAMALGGISAAKAADLTGTDVTISWLFPDESTTYAAQTVTVGAGPELVCPGNNVGSGLCVGFVDGASFDIGSNTLNLTITSGTDSWTGAGFNGYEFSGLSAGGPWTGYSLSTDFSGLDTSRVTFTPDAVFVNMQGITPNSGQSFTISLLSGAPEPSTWALMIGGFGLVGGTLRRRRPTAVAA